MNKIILIGIPGCGKTTLGKKLAKALRLPFFDTDKLMLKNIKLESSIDIFRLAFQDQFIIIQKEIISDLSKKVKPAVISTGAEIALIPECSALLKKMGTIIHIQRNPELVLTDIKKNRPKKFVMTMNSEEIDMHKEGIKLYMEEYSHYEALADLKIENNGNIDEGLEKLIKLIRDNSLVDI